MGRTPIGPAARKNTASIRLTDDEKNELSRRFGNPGKALRSFVNTVMAARQQEEKK